MVCMFTEIKKEWKMEWKGPFCLKLHYLLLMDYYNVIDKWEMYGLISTVILAKTFLIFSTHEIMFLIAMAIIANEMLTFKVYAINYHIMQLSTKVHLNIYTCSHGKYWYMWFVFSSIDYFLIAWQA